MTLKQIHLVNIQAHKDNVFELPETGIVRFAGNNSAGKSAVFKPLFYLLTGQIRKPRDRAGLITWGTSYGEATYTRYDDVSLKIHVALEAAATWVEISSPANGSIKRYLADKSYTQLAEVFGIHYNQNRDLSLNYASGDGPIMFFTTPHCANGDMVNIALTDGPSNVALATIEETIKQAQTVREKASASIPLLNETLNAITLYDEEALSNKQSQLIACYNVLSTIYIPDIPDIHAVPKVDTLSVYIPQNLPTVRFPRVYDVKCHVEDIRREAADLREVMEGKCPTCGRRLCDVS